jgi:hypothetical protein
MIVVIMLMHTVSLALQLPSCVNILNLCPNVKLSSPVYFGNGATCPKLSDQTIDISTKMKIYFEIYVTQDDFEGALLYKLQRYVEYDDQYNIDTSATETNRDGSKCVQMLVAWKMKDYKLFLHVALVEHAKEFTWNESELKNLYDKNCDWLKEYNDTISDIWFIDDNMVLKTTSNVRDLKGNFRLSISISEEERDEYAMRPLYVDLER